MSVYLIVKVYPKTYILEGVYCILTPKSGELKPFRSVLFIPFSCVNTTVFVSVRF